MLPIKPEEERQLDPKKSGDVPSAPGLFNCSNWNITSCRVWRYNSVVPQKRRKTQTKKTRSRGKSVGGIFASVEDDLLALVEEEARADARWNRPRKQRLTLRIDCEVVDWFKSKGPGYQTRMTRILRHVMAEGKKREKKG